MLSPTVTEIPRSLEPTARDTFLDMAVSPAPRHPRGDASRLLPDNVFVLRPAVASSSADVAAAA